MKNRTKLEKIDSILTDENKKIISKLLIKYFKCEFLIRIVLNTYFDIIGESIKQEDIDLKFKDIENAINLLQIDINYKYLDKIFGKGDKRNKKSYKNLRNKIVHSLNTNDIKELLERKEEIEKDLDNFINILYSNDIFING